MKRTSLILLSLVLGPGIGVLVARIDSPALTQLASARGVVGTA